MRRNSASRKSPIPENVVEVRGDYITLGQLLKVAGLIPNGGFAKQFLSETVIFVNGEPDQRRGRKLRPGDIVIPRGGERIRLVGSKQLVCPVCFWPAMQLPLCNDKGEPSGEICPCCGTEFNVYPYPDAVIALKRTTWFTGGQRWTCPDIRRAPAGWSANAQLHSFEPLEIGRADTAEDLST